MKTTITILFSFILFLNLKAQNYNHDIGVFLGATSLSSDYGESNDIMSGATNNGTSFAIAHYLQFYNKCNRWDRNASSRFTNHIMLKTEFRYSNSSNLQNFTSEAEGNSLSAQKARNMRGSLSIFNVSTNFEYYLLPLRSYINSNKFAMNPFISFGVNFSSYNRDISYDSLTSQKGENSLAKGFSQNEAFYLGIGDSFSFSGAFGTRIKVSYNADIVTQFGIQYFLADDLEGINANVPQNTSNDWLGNFQLGLVYRL